MSILRALTLFPMLFTVAPLSAQRAGPGLGWYGSSGNTAVSYVSDCTPRTVAAQRRETVTLRVWGDMNSPFVLFAAVSATSCIPIPGFGGSLVADGPLATLATFVLTLRGLSRNPRVAASTLRADQKGPGRLVGCGRSGLRIVASRDDSPAYGPGPRPACPARRATRISCSVSPARFRSARACRCRRSRSAPRDPRSPSRSPRP